VVELAATYQIPDSAWSVGGQYKGTDYEDTNSAIFFGFKTQLKAERYALEFSYSKNSDDANSPGTLGHVPWFRSDNYTLSVNDIFAGVETLNGKISYDFGIKHLNTSLQHSLIYQSELGLQVSGRNLDDAQQTSIDVRYRLQGLEDLSMRLVIAYTQYDQKFDDNDFLGTRLTIKYDF
jgi:hypothetical protein